MLREEFAGANKAGTSFLSPLEQRMARRVVPHIPAWLETYHLTMLTLVWCAFIVVSGYLAATRDIRWLWLMSLMVACQYVTDHFDGKVGKYRNTGLVKWGFYMDHLLDYLFLCSALAAYGMLVPERARLYLFAVLAVCGGFMVNSFLAFAATSKFKISALKLGPTEFRIALVVINTLVIAYGPKHLAKSLPYVAAGGFLFLCILVYQTQKEIWRRDMEAREK
jgi:phosphatidylglycerophosphate synthase